MKKMTAILSLMLISSTVFASEKSDIKIMGTSAEKIIAAFTSSGISPFVDQRGRGFEVDQVSFAQPLMKNKDCKEIDLKCGIQAPFEFNTLFESANNITENAKEAIQLKAALDEIVQPYLAKNKLSIKETSEDSLIVNYGSVSCFWDVEVKNKLTKIKNAKCDFKIGAF